MKHQLLLIGAALSLYSTNLFAHGEDKAGPHGGYVRMPGAFHTEVIKEQKDKLRVYLLDINWKNPSVKDSSVEATIKNGKQRPFFLVRKKRIHMFAVQKTEL